MAAVTKNERILVLFDVDGTLTVARKEGKPDIFEMLEKLRERVTIGFVGGSDLPKQIEQLGSDVLNKFDYCFPQNGVEGYKNGELFARKSFNEFLGEERMSKLINGLLGYMAKLELPIKRGTFIEYRQGMLNVSPIGRNCSRAERNDYEKFDLANNIRKDMVAWVQENFGTEYGLKASIGGQISFDLFPIGWDKTLCLSHFKPDQFDEIHFFGDKTYEGGNDYEIYEDKRTVGHVVKSPEDTKRIVNELWLKDVASEAVPTTSFADILAAGKAEGQELDPLVVAYTMGFASAAGLS